VLYSAVQAAVDNIGDLRLVDFTSTENVCLSHLPGKQQTICRRSRIEVRPTALPSLLTSGVTASVGRCNEVSYRFFIGGVRCACSSRVNANLHIGPNFLCMLPMARCAFSALTLLVGRQEGHPARKKLSGGMLAWYLSGARCRLAYGPADATASHCLLLQ